MIYQDTERAVAAQKAVEDGAGQTEDEAAAEQAERELVLAEQDDQVEYEEEQISPLREDSTLNTHLANDNPT